MAILQRPLPVLRLPAGAPVRRLAIVVAIALAVAIAAFQVNQYSSAARTSYELNDLNRLRAAKQARNHELEAEVAKLSSLARVDIEARVRLGMVPADRKLYLQVNQPLPPRESLPTRYLPRPNGGATPPDGRESWWRRAVDALLPF
jgi:cell division protein FtsL